MGFMWTFEIIAGLADDNVHEAVWYFTDAFNMFQGFYVFLIFVCKRNVLYAILDIKPRRDESVTGTLKQRFLSARFSKLTQHQTEMVSLNTMSNSNTPSRSLIQESQPKPKVIAAPDSKFV